MKLQSLPSLSLFEKALHEIAGELGIPVFKAPLTEEQENNLPPCCLIIAPLKGNGVPNERVAEKTKDYEKDILESKFEKENSKAGEGMSHVKDINRASIMMRDEEQILLFIDKIKQSKVLFFVRLKNMFKQLGPTHYRRINCAVGVYPKEGVLHICELQVHQKEIHDRAPDHKVYEYFRKIFSSLTSILTVQWTTGSSS